MFPGMVLRFSVDENSVMRFRCLEELFAELSHLWRLWD